MNTLDEAWSWYESTRASLILIRRLGGEYWSELPWSGALGGDERFKSLDGPVVVKKSEVALQHLNDLAVLVIFSVFENIVRERVKLQLFNERLNINNPQIQAIVKIACERIEKGDFSLILDIYKPENVNLTEAVKQVRRYRNWVAHGRRTSKPEFVDPLAAFNRLNRYLEVLEFD